MIIKVCGMREPDNIRAVEALRPDWMGFIFWPGSRRCVTTPPAYLPQPPLKRVGVFVQPSLEEVVQRVREWKLDLVQLHGSESADWCRELKAATCKPIIKAFSIATSADLLPTVGYADLADYFLFDTRTPLMGGSGRQFDWNILDAYDGSTPFLLSGGIGPDDASRIAAYSHPRCIGFDLNSRFETAPAIKDAEALGAFIRQLVTSQK